MLGWKHPEGLCGNLGVIAQTDHCNHRMAPDTKKTNSRLPPGRRVMEKSIVAIFAEPLSLHYQVCHYFRESICAQQDGRLDCHISAAGQPQYIHQQEQHAEDQEVTLVALGREVVPEKSCFFFNIVQKRGGGSAWMQKCWVNLFKAVFATFEELLF